MQHDKIDFSKYNTKWNFINFNECIFENYIIKLLHDKTYYLYHNNMYIKSSMDYNELFLYVDNKLSEKIVCIYHKDCTDGFASAWVLNNYFNEQHKLVEYISLSYGMELPVIENSRIYLLDFSFDTIEIYENYLEKNNKIIIIDHHKKSMELLKKYNHDKLLKFMSIDYSGCYLTWNYFYGDISNKNIPKVIEYIQDRDLFKFELPLSKEMLCVIDLWDFDFDTWDKNSIWFDRNTNSVMKKGSDILEYKQKLINKMYKKRHYCDFVNIKWDGTINGCVKTSDVFKNILCVNSNLSEIGSEVAELMYNDDKERFVIVYHFDPDGLKLSFRSKSDIGMDVNEIAKHFGGGGHKHASGCKITCDIDISIFLDSFQPIEK